ncbi:hypothetical protein [Oceanirhabdus sp. W0125-5]|uniref:hypothetical protein n=1 Tax=Oceanirhabdus sp. W0125-5 TaxID=2999116 RepID=UPI0022F2BAA6|nr:hypothetical protein [Oceanirhabdus sp. W0125-5]WBW97427.1 hypothetical protein OW730_00805 [Oceanirhabdus sp. W0125-5]
MIILDNLDKYRRGRVWIDELPNMSYDVIQQLHSFIEIKSNSEIQAANLALELSLPRGASNYALVGLRYTPTKNKVVEIKVNVSRNTGEIINDNIASQIDQVHVGIPLEYANVVLNTARSVIQEINDYPSGIIEFNLGAHGLIGSSQVIFSKITSIIIKLLCKNPSIMSSEAIKNEIFELLNQEK